MKRILLTGATGFVGGFFLRNYSDFYKIKIFSFLNDNFQDLNLNNIDVVIHCSALVHQMNGASKDQYSHLLEASACQRVRIKVARVVSETLLGDQDSKA